MAISKRGFENIPTLKMEESSLNAFIALNISIITKTVRDKVDAVFFPTVKYKHGSFSNSVNCP